MTTGTAVHQQDSNAARRARWARDEATRERVKNDLYEWGGAQRGGLDDLGYYREQVFCKTPAGGPPPHDPDKVQLITDTFTLWRLIGEWSEAPARAQIKRMHSVLIRYFVHQGPVARMARMEGTSRRHFYRLLGDAMFTFWVLHYLPRDGRA